MVYEKVCMALSIFFIVCAIGLYLYTKEFSILFFGLLLAGMASGRYSNRLGRLRIIRDPEADTAVRKNIAKKWLTSVESKSDRFATNYVTPAIIFIGLIIAVLKRSMEVFYFILLLILIDTVDRFIITRMDKHSKWIFDKSESINTGNDPDRQEE
jgi:hypothetical protein